MLRMLKVETRMLVLNYNLLVCSHQYSPHTTVELINDSSRGVQETYAALSEAQLGALADIPKNTVPVSIITGKHKKERRVG